MPFGRQGRAIRVAEIFGKREKGGKEQERDRTGHMVRHPERREQEDV